MKKVSNLTIAQLDYETLEFLINLFKLYDITKKNGNIYKNNDNIDIITYLIQQYYKYVKPDYNNMIYSFRRKYISNEILVEKNDSPEEREGMSLVYDFIQKFDINKDYFNIFYTSLQIHSLLYRPLDEKFIAKKKEILNQITILEKEAKKEKNIEKYKLAKELSKTQEYVTFGGKLRNTDAIMNDFGVEIPSSSEISKIFNSYLNPEKIQEYESILENSDLISYINYVVNTTAELIGMQPFSDGNKRTFRSLLNLMLKKKNLPPVYITKRERKVYHNALEKAIKFHDYTDLDRFYYYKICDSIYELDFKPFFSSQNYTNNNIEKSNISQKI